MCRKLIHLVSFVLVLSLALTSAVESADPSLVGWWKFDEGSGTTAFDSSDSGNHGTLNGDPQWITDGRVDGALDFDGTEDYVQVQRNIQDSFTMTAWIKTDTPGLQLGSQGYEGTGLIWSDIAGVANDFILAVLGTKLSFFCGNPDLSVNSDRDVVTGEWIHVAATRSAQEGKIGIYINGEHENTLDHANNGPLDALDTIAIGGNVLDSRYYTGVIDEVKFYDKALTQEEILDVMQGASDASSDPNPEDEATDVSRNVILSWRPGKFANRHDVYFGTDFNDVNDATIADPMGLTISEGQNANTFDTGRLEFGQTYYWRVDEVNDAHPESPWKGSVWSFTTEPVAYPLAVAHITATASSMKSAEENPTNTINGSGLDANDTHSTSTDSMWLSDVSAPGETWILYDFDQLFKLHQVLVWNYNYDLEDIVGFGIKEALIETSQDGETWETFGTIELAQAVQKAPVDLQGIVARHVRITAQSNWSNIFQQYGLSEVRFLYIPVQARESQPDSGATDVNLDVSLSWRAGREAAEHNVYFSDDEQAVIDGTADMTTVTDNSYGPLGLDLGRTYYWRVDEVNNPETPSTWQGEVWDFTTFEYFVIDDFEDYNDFEPDRLFDAWIDGWGIATNGSTIGYPEPIFIQDEHFVETTIVNSGSQSMPYFFDNTTAGNSEATLTLSTLRNWTEKGIGSLTLWYRGNPVGLVEDPAGTYTINASGADIWDTADEFRYVYKQLSGPGSIIARVESVEDTDPWAKAGVMIRESLDANSKFAAVYITPGNGCTFQARLTTALDATSDTSVATPEQIAITAPYWVKIERGDVANNFNGYYSSDGINWVAMSWNPQNTAMSEDVYIGLALTSHSSGVNCTAVFSNVQTTGAVSPQTWTQEAIGVEMPSNDAAQMYVVLNGSAAVYNDDSDAVLTDEWTEWSIDLQEFADQGVDLADVDTLGIGFGDRDNQQLGSTGVVYFDDIRLYPLVPEQEPAL